MKKYRTNNIASPVKYIGFKHLVLSCVLFLFTIPVSLAQCAMCRASVESTLNTGNVGLASRLNTGILYLFVAPYLAVAIVGYLWYKKSKENARLRISAEDKRSSISMLK